MIFIADDQNNFVFQMKTFILLSILSFGASEKKNDCPPPEDLPGCSCNLYGQQFVCKDILNPWDLKFIVNYLSNYKVYKLRLEYSSLMYLPKGLFVDFPISQLELYHCEIFGLESDDEAEMFRGLENSLTILDFANITGMDAWRWSALKGLRNLITIHIRWSDLTKIDKDFASVSPESVLYIQLQNDKIKHIYQNAFKNHINLKHIDLSENEITEISRDMFPKPATHLGSMMLSTNKIEVIPSDFFTEMPTLSMINLNYNNVKFLSPEIFQPLKSLSWFDIEYNDIHCCSNMKFFTKAKYRERIVGTCKYPEILKDKSFTELKDIDLDHGIC